MATRARKGTLGASPAMTARAEAPDDPRLRAWLERQVVWPAALYVRSGGGNPVRLKGILMRMPHLLQALLDRVESSDEINYEDAGVRVAHVAVGGEPDRETLTLHLELSGVYDDSPMGSWRVLCSGVADWRLARGDADPLEHWHDDHPLLWEHKTEHQELYFVGRPEDPVAAAGALYERHLRETWGYIAPKRFLNDALSWDLSHLLDGGYGLLAIGPGPLLDAYADVMTKVGIRNNALPYVPGVSRPSAQLLTLGHESYVVADDFVAEETM